MIRGLWRNITSLWSLRLDWLPQPWPDSEQPLVDAAPFDPADGWDTPLGEHPDLPIMAECDPPDAARKLTVAPSGMSVADSLRNEIATLTDALDNAIEERDMWHGRYEKRRNAHLDALREIRVLQEQLDHLNLK